jgi:hypothetical protein
VVSQISPSTLTDLGSKARICRETAAKECEALISLGWATAVRGQHGKMVISRMPEAAQDEATEMLISERECAPFLGEFLSKKFLDLFIPSAEYIDNGRPAFLRSADSKGPLEYDRFYYKHGVAVEYNGDQHYVTNEQYASEQELRERQLRDFNKARLSQKNGIILVEIVDEDLTLEGMRKKIPSALPTVRIQEDSRYVHTLVDMAMRHIQNMRKKRAGGR